MEPADDNFDDNCFPKTSTISYLSKLIERYETFLDSPLSKTTISRHSRRRNPLLITFDLFYGPGLPPFSAGSLRFSPRFRSEYLCIISHSTSYPSSLLLSADRLPRPTYFPIFYISPRACSSIQRHVYRSPVEKISRPRPENVFTGRPRFIYRIPSTNPRSSCYITNRQSLILARVFVLMFLYTCSTL